MTALRTKDEHLPLGTKDSLVRVSISKTSANRHKTFEVREGYETIRMVRIRTTAYVRTCETEHSTMYDGWSR